MTANEAHEILTAPRDNRAHSLLLAAQKIREAKGFLHFARIAEKASWRHQHIESAAKARRLAVMYLGRSK